MDLDRLLVFTHQNKPSEKDLDAIGEYLLRTFSEFMDQEIACFQKHIVPGEALVLNVRNTSGAQGPFAVQWDGVLLYGVRDESPAIQAEIFLFSHGERIGILTEQGNAYAIYRYKIENNEGAWKFEFWHGDEYDEWTYIEKPREELYGKFEKTYG